MRGILVNAGLATIIAMTLLAYELGVFAPANAFFAAAAVLILYTGYQFARREGMPLGEALADIFARPPSAAGAPFTSPIWPPWRSACRSWPRR